MTTLNRDDLKALMDDVLLWADKCAEMEKLAKEAVGETRSAYAIVHRDYLWKIQRKIGQLWFYVCGSADMNPFELEKELTPPASE